MQPNPKWQFAIGTTSRVPDSGGILHYFIADFDEKWIPERALDFIQKYARNFIVQKTDHGWHVYTDIRDSFDQITSWLKGVDVDETWLKIGKERGYLFLADKSQIVFPWPVERMCIYIEKEER